MEQTYCLHWADLKNIKLVVYGIRVQIHSLVTAWSQHLQRRISLAAQEIRDEAMDLRLRANQDFEKVMVDTFGYAKVSHEGGSQEFPTSLGYIFQKRWHRQNNFPTVWSRIFSCFGRNPRR